MPLNSAQAVLAQNGLVPLTCLTGSRLAFFDSCSTRACYNTEAQYQMTQTFFFIISVTMEIVSSKQPHRSGVVTAS